MSITPVGLLKSHGEVACEKDLAGRAAQEVDKHGDWRMIRIQWG